MRLTGINGIIDNCQLIVTDITMKFTEVMTSITLIPVLPYDKNNAWIYKIQFVAAFVLMLTYL